MTLIITVLTKLTIYQSADYRLTHLGTGEITTDASTKLVMLHYGEWEGFVAYTGIGQWNRRDTSDYVMKWLEGLDNTSISDVAARIRDRGTDWLGTIAAASRGWQRHTFILASFDSGVTRLDVISNFEDCVGRNEPHASSSLMISTSRFRGQAKVVVSGCKPAVSRHARRQLKRVVRGVADDPARVRKMLTKINAEAARAPAAQKMISPGCSVVSLRADGRGACDVDGEVNIHSMVWGMRSPDIQEIAKKLGAPRLMGMTFASSKSWIPYAPCHPRTITPVDTGGYNAREVSLQNFATCWAHDVNDVGVVLGAGELDGQPGNKVLWTAPLNGDPTACRFIAEPGGINDAGEVAAKARMNDSFEHAVRWSGGEVLIDLGCFRGKDSGATAINAAGLVVGWVSVDSVNRGQGNFRPAAWLSDKPIVLEDFGCDWGQAVDVNDAGAVLVVAYAGMRCRAILWNPLAGTMNFIEGKTGIYPSAITADGVVLGTAPDRNGKQVAFLAEPGQQWEALGTPPGFYATAMNNAGDVVGAANRDGYEKPWLRRVSGTIHWLPYLDHHHCRPWAINNYGVIVGKATTDHGSHALIWSI